MNDKTRPTAGSGDASGQQTSAGTGTGTGAGQVGAAAPQQPSIGRIVHVRDWSRGQDPAVIAAALVTTVHSPTCINVTVFPDGAAPYCQTSLALGAPGELKPGEWQWPTRS